MANSAHIDDRRNLTGWPICILFLLAFLCQPARALAAPKPLAEISAIRDLPRNQLNKGLPVDVEGHISLVLPTKRTLYLTSAGGNLAVMLVDQSNRLAVGSKVRVEGVTVAQRQGHIRARQIHVLEGPDVTPEFRTLSVPELLADPPFHEVVEVRGVVHKRMNRGSRLLIELRDRNQTAQLSLFGANVRNEPDRFYFSTSRIRAAVIPNASNQPDRFQLAARGWESVTVEKPEPEFPFQAPINRVAEILQVPKDKLMAERAHVRGRIVRVRTDGSAVLDDGTGKMVILPRYQLNVEVGNVADVVGYTEVSTDGNSIQLEQTRTRRLRLPLDLSKDPARKNDWPRYLAEMNNLKNVRFLSLGGLTTHPPVRLRGNIVYVDAQAGGFILQNETAGIEIIGHDADFELKTGPYVEVVGYAEKGRAAAVINHAAVTRLPDRRIANPIVPSPEGLAGGRFDGMWIDFEGVGRTVSRVNDETHLTLARGDRKIIVRIPDGEPDDFSPLVDARLRVEGIARAIADEHGEMNHSEIVVGSITNITVENPAADPSDLPVQQIADLRRIRPGGGFARRYRTVGTLILAWPGMAYLAEGNHFLRVRITDALMRKWARPSM